MKQNKDRVTNVAQFAHNFSPQINDIISIFNTRKGVQHRLTYVDIV